LVANFVRKNNTAEILLAMPWTDSARTELICDQIEMLPVSAKLLPAAQIRMLAHALLDVRALSSLNCNARRE
jgi:hypothetical protein